MPMSVGLIRNSITFLSLLFLAIVLFYVLGGPVDVIFDAFTDNPVVPEQATYTPNFKLAARMAFAIGIATPVVWFFVKMFSREPAQFVRRRR